MNNEQPTIEQLQEQLHRQNQLIQGLQGEIGALTGDKMAITIAYQEAQQALDKVQADEIAELDKQAEGG